MSDTAFFYLFFDAGLNILAGFVFFAPVTRKLTAAGHSGLNAQFRQNPLVQDKPDGDDAEDVKDIHSDSYI
ncbi:MAG TPA: hypothetical protein VIR78_00465 [Malonomonas sp.]